MVVLTVVALLATPPVTPPSPALKSLDKEGRVIHIGSFSKSLFPGLRLGYIVGSRAFIREARALRATVLRHPPGHVQRTAAYFMSGANSDTCSASRVRRRFAASAVTSKASGWRRTTGSTSREKDRAGPVSGCARPQASIPDS